MIPRSLDFHIQKGIQAYEIFFTCIKLLHFLGSFSQGHHTSGNFFYISKAVDVCERGFFLYNFLGRPRKYIRVETFFLHFSKKGKLTTSMV